MRVYIYDAQPDIQIQICLSVLDDGKLNFLDTLVTFCLMLLMTKCKATFAWVEGEKRLLVGYC